jgi:hypothetical protein
MPNLVNAWKDINSEAIYLFEDEAISSCDSYVDGYVIQFEESKFLHVFYEDYFDAEMALVQKYGGVSIGPDYIAIYDQEEELCYWQEDEWLKEPELAINLANAIRIYYTRGPAYMREVLGK